MVYNDALGILGNILLLCDDGIRAADEPGDASDGSDD